MLLLAREKVEYLELLPTILHDVIEIDAISKVEKPILEDEWFYVNNSIDNNFVEYANEYGIIRFESMLGIIAPGTDDLQTRRLRILARMQEQAPYTNRVLVRILDSLLGAGAYEYTRNVATKHVNVKIELTVQRQYDILNETLERLLPANMTYLVELRYNMHSLLRPFTHQELSAKTHQQLREEPI